MNRQALANELNLLLTTETRGLARHLREATPYITSATYAAWADIQHMLDTGAEHARRLSTLMEQAELPERASSFQLEVANFHFTDLGYMLPQIIEEKRDQVAAYQRALEHAGDDDAIAAELDALLADNQKQLEQLDRHHRNITGGSKLAQHG